MDRRQIRRAGNTRIRSITLRVDQFLDLERIAIRNAEADKIGTGKEQRPNVSAVIREAVDQYIATDGRNG